jgi:hypothetical protein
VLQNKPRNNAKTSKEFNKTFYYNEHSLLANEVYDLKWPQNKFHMIEALQRFLSKALLRGFFVYLSPAVLFSLCLKLFKLIKSLK